MADTIRALCAELAKVLAEEYGVEREFTSGEPLVGTGAIELLARVRAALAQPEAEGPTDEAADLTPAQETAPERIWLHMNGANEWLPFKHKDDVFWVSDQIDKSDIPYVRADLARWGRPTMAKQEAEGPTDEEVLKLAKHPITPPPELVQHWIAQVWHEGTPVQVAASDLHVATQAARWGADKMLEGEPHGPTNEDLLGLDELRDAWNAQADASNSWDELGMDEIMWFAQQQALARWGRPAPAPIPVAERLPREEED